MKKLKHVLPSPVPKDLYYNENEERTHVRYDRLLSTIKECEHFTLSEFLQYRKETLDGINHRGNPLNVEFYLMWGIFEQIEGFFKTGGVVHYDNPASARYMTDIKGWVDKDNRFFGDNNDSEHNARWSSCTHMNCECGRLREKSFTLCLTCRTFKEFEDYINLPFKEFDGEFPLYSHYVDEYFWDEDGIVNFCEENEVLEKELRLIICSPVKYAHVREDYWHDDLPDDSDIPDKLKQVLENLNSVIDELPPASYYPSKIRTETHYTKEK